MSSSEWKKYKLGDIAEIVMGQSPSGETCNEVGEGLPLLNGPTEFTNYSPLPVQFTNDPRKISEIGDLLFCVRGSTTGKMNWSDKKYAIGRGLAAIRHKKGNAFQPFLKALIELNLNNILLHATGSTFPNVSSLQLLNLDVLVPNAGTQQRIATILSSLDDKIELNRQTNETLEAMAQALFQEMCVPKGEGLPKGWRVGKLGENIKILNGFAFKGVDFIEKGVPVIKIKNVKAGKVILNELSYVSREVADKTHRFRVNQNDLLITMSGNRIDGTPDTWVGKVGLFHGHGEYLLNQRVSKLVPENNEVVSNYFLCQLLSSKDFQYHFISNATSSGGQANISPDLIKDIDLFIPPITDMKKFNESMKVIYEKIFQTEDENQTLIALRDTLLPKLMRGEINVESL